MKLRGITVADIETALRGYVQTEPAHNGDFKYIGPDVGNRRLLVIVVKPGVNSNPIIIKSVMWRSL